MFRKRRRRKQRQKFIRKIMRIFLSSIIFIAVVIFYLIQTLPDISNLESSIKKPVIEIKASDATMLSTYGDSGNYAYFKNLPDNLINAVLATEDQRFFSHYGVDFRGVARAFINNLQKGNSIQGASTITQQLAKMAFLSPERTITRKIKEVILSFYIEQKYNKKEILEMYLNKAYFGSGNYGITAASQNYFGKNVSELNINESAMLVGLLKAPSKYSPKANPLLSEKRTKQILKNMINNEVISAEQLMIAEYQDNAWHNEYNSSSNYRYFSDWIKNEIDDVLEVKTNNATAYTTFNPEIHDIANQVIAKYYKQFPEHLSKSQIAFIAMRPDGRILTIIGGKNYKQSQYNRAIYAKRQPGSLFKVFVYLSAIENGYRNDDKVVDEPIDINGWQPQNYNEEYLGEITLRSAFVQSVNSIAVKLSHEIGIESVINNAHKLGITTPIDKLPATALGTSELTLLELVTAYAHFSNGGNSVKPYGIIKISDDAGKTLFKHRINNPEQKINEVDYEQLDDLMYATTEWGTARAAQIAGRKVRGKTGTSQDYRDAWFIGYSDDIIAGIWIGNDDNTPLDNITGGSFPTKIWQEIISKSYADSII